MIEAKIVEKVKCPLNIGGNGLVAITSVYAKGYDSFIKTANSYIDAGADVILIPSGLENIGYKSIKRELNVPVIVQIGEDTDYKKLDMNHLDGCIVFDSYVRASGLKEKIIEAQLPVLIENNNPDEFINLLSAGNYIYGEEASNLAFIESNKSNDFKDHIRYIKASTNVPIVFDFSRDSESVEYMLNDLSSAIIAGAKAFIVRVSAKYDPSSKQSISPSDLKFIKENSKPIYEVINGV